MARQIVNGDRVRDTITGLKGIVICESKWLHGCRRLTIQPERLHEGKALDYVSFDEPQLELVETKQSKSTSGGGGPRPEPRR